jgi:hypothetical protein
LEDSAAEASDSGYAFPDNKSLAEYAMHAV